MNKKCNYEDGTNNDCWSEVESVSNMHMLFHNKSEQSLIEKLESDCDLIEFETNILLLVCIIVLLFIIIIPIFFFFLLKKYSKKLSLFETILNLQ